MTIEYDIIRSSDEEKDIVQNKLIDFNCNILGFNPESGHEPLNYVIKYDSRIIAGINAYFYFHKSLQIDILFVDENHRGQGLGTGLLNTVENAARVMGATLSHLDTFDFQAKDFYLKHSYKVFGVLEDCPEGHKRYYMSKKL